MKLLRKWIYVLAACITAGTFVSPAVAAGLADDPFIRQNTNRANFEPGGKYHLFGSRGSVAERNGAINVTPVYSHQVGNLQIEQATIQGDIGYIVRFSGHGYQEHSPFDNHASRSSSDEKGNALDGFTLYHLDWSGNEHHPSDAYDGPQGGGYPVPTGARDEYSYHIEGKAQSINLKFNDNRSTEQRFADRFGNLGSNFANRAEEANKKIFEHDPNLGFAGNGFQIINGLALAASNGFQSIGEVIGVGDAVDGVKGGSSIGTMHSLEWLSTDGKMAIISGLGGTAGFANDAQAGISNWAAQHPNAAEGISAAVNVASAVVPAWRGVQGAKGSITVGKVLDKAVAEASVARKARGRL